eukprot:6151510-Amphidinium_carterae.1
MITNVPIQRKALMQQAPNNNLCGQHISSRFRKMTMSHPFRASVRSTATKKEVSRKAEPPIYW